MGSWYALDVSSSFLTDLVIMSPLMFVVTLVQVGRAWISASTTVCTVIGVTVYMQCSHDISFYITVYM